jgi:hypothetical protein
MKRSSARRARRQVIQELTRSLDQLSGIPVAATLTNDCNTSAGE